MADEPGAGATGAVAVRLTYRAPLAVPPLARFLAGHAVPGLERHDAAAGEHTRVVPGPHGPAVVTVRLAASPGALDARLRVADPADVAAVTTRIRRWLDLDADPDRIDRALAADSLLRPLVRRRPGLRVPGAVDGTETALLAVLGQHVSLRTARTFAGRLVAAFGRPAGDGLVAFPPAEVLAAAGPEQLRAAVGLTGARARALHALGAAAADGLALDPPADPAATRAALLAVPGIGPWTAEYVALRALGDPDAFPAGDLVLRRALGVATARQAADRAAGWRPWRGYAVLHLWTAAVFG